MSRTNSKHWLSVTALSVFAALLVNACTGTTTNNTYATSDDSGVGTVVLPDGAVVACTPNAKECLNPSLARVCPADGSAWLAQQCKVGEKCDKGVCGVDPNALCLPGSGSCVSATTALRCRANLQGFAQTTCPTGTTCQGEGLCAGACVVGSSGCIDTGNLGTCLDGNTYTATACSGTDLCVDVAISPFPVSACQPAACKPDAQGCNTVCGNKSDPLADQTKFTSTCIQTPTGFKYVASSCLAGKTCNPTGQSCGAHGEAICASDCTPGQSRCSSDKLSTQICGADGKWAGVTACNANPAATSLVCQTSPVDPTTVLCGDPICATGAAGSCDATGLRACGPDGKLAATGTACVTGSCSITGASPIGGITPGACIVECNAGDERCTSLGSTSYQTCSASGRWTTAVACPSADGGAAAATCFGFATPAQRPAKICGGVCTPGQTKCVSGDGGAVTDSIETCSAAAQWGPTATCTVGLCTAGIAGAGAACVAQCIPNSLVCVGGGKAVVGTQFFGTNAFGTCSAQGLLPTSGTTSCTGDAVCRHTAAGTVAPGGNACIECIGSAVAGGNELGAVDTRCSDSAGVAASNQAAQTCAANNTWTAGAGTLDCIASGKTCFAADFDVCSKENAGLPRTESYYEGGGRGHSQVGPRTCTTTRRGNLGPPARCGVTADCCSTQCQHATVQVATCK